MDDLCFVCLMLSRLFIAALWSPAGKGLTSWLLLVMLIVFLLLSHVVSWVRCGTLLYRFLIFAIFLTLIFAVGGYWMAEHINWFNVSIRPKGQHFNIFYCTFE